MGFIFALAASVYGCLKAVIDSSLVFANLDQAAMNKTPDEANSHDLLYDHLDEKDELWFDFIADTGDGGNSTYSVARLLAQPSLFIKADDSRLTLPRGQLLLIGGDLAYVSKY